MIPQPVETQQGVAHDAVVWVFHSRPEHFARRGPARAPLRFNRVSADTRIPLLPQALFSQARVLYAASNEQRCPRPQSRIGIAHQVSQRTHDPRTGGNHFEQLQNTLDRRVLGIAHGSVAPRHQAHQLGIQLRLELAHLPRQFDRRIPGEGVRIAELSGELIALRQQLHQLLVADSVRIAPQRQPGPKKACPILIHQRLQCAQAGRTIVRAHLHRQLYLFGDHGALRYMRLSAAEAQPLSSEQDSPGG